jgi:two-component system NtrC family sensor kinase
MMRQDWPPEVWLGSRREGPASAPFAVSRAGPTEGSRGAAAAARYGSGKMSRRREAAGLRWSPLDALETLLEAVPEGILVFDADSRVRFANRRFRELFGLKAEGEDPRGPLEDLAAALAGRTRSPAEFIRRWRARHDPAAGPGADEVELLEPVRRVLERAVHPILTPEGERAGIVEVYRDLTPERQIHNKLAQTEKMAALGQLVSGIAHELNNPLTSIMGYAQLLLGRRPALRDRRSGDAEKIYQEAERAARLVRNLLVFARETKPERAPVDLNEIVERTLALRSYELKVSNIEVVFDLDPHLPRTLADAHQLQQVVLNLVVNAEQAIQQSRGAGQIRISTRRIGGQRIALEVADDGPGIPAELASRVFDPFFTTKPLGVGTGLGLSIAYGIVQEHGGDIYVGSRAGRGATFVVELPIAEREAGAEPARDLTTRASPALPARSRTARRILVVEDEPTVAQLVADVLAEQGHDVTAVLDSVEGLDLALAGGFDLVICDLRMPQVDGRAFYDALLEARSPLARQLFFITGDTLAPRTLEFLEREGIPYLAKPFLVEELTLAVNRALNGGEAASVPGRPPKGER